MSLIVLLIVLLVVLVAVGLFFWNKNRVAAPVAPNTSAGVEPLANPAIDSHGVPTVPGLGANDGSTPPTA